MPWTYRPELDGLRTVAVYLVVLFHGGLSIASGGFIGVDLFFVLSGFLVSSILLDEQDRLGRINLWRFYGRRVRRLLPAAVVVVVSTCAVFVLIASSVRRLPLIGDAQSALLYVSNWRFLRQQNDYFGADIYRSPFLHFWSLSIEEQFYLGLPILLVGLIALTRRNRRALTVGVALLMAASLGAQLWWAQLNVNHAYYGTETRVYQLLLGVLAALLVRRLGLDNGSRGAGYEALAGVGLVAVLVLGSQMLDLTPSTRGIAAAMASCAVLIGLFLRPRGWTAVVLAQPFVNYLGRISYGTYLWHWPVVLILLEVLDTRPIVIAGLTVAIATGLASLSFHVLEHPIRTARHLASHARGTVLVGLATSVLVALFVVPPILLSSAKPVLHTEAAAASSVGDRAIPDGVDWSAYANDKGPDDLYCSQQDHTSCVVHTGTSGLHVALVGDSHGRMLASAFEDLAEQHDFTLSLNIIEACPWPEDVLGRRDSGPLVTACETNRSELYSGLINEMDVDLVVLTQLPRDRGGYLDNSGLSAHDFDAYNLASMKRTLEAITGQGADAVMVRPMLQVPEELPNPLECLSGARRTGACRVPIPLEAAPSDSFVETLALTVPGASGITINDLMCPDAPVCEPLDGDTPVWRDRRHFAPAAIRLHEDEMWSRILESQEEVATSGS